MSNNLKQIAIRNRIEQMQYELGQIAEGIGDVCELLEMTDAKVLQRILKSVGDDYHLFIRRLGDFCLELDGENPDEIEVMAYLYNGITRSSRKLDGLMKNVENVFRTSSLDDASTF